MEENKMEVFNELVKRNPKVELMTLEEIVPIIFISESASKWAVEKIRLGKKLGVVQEQLDATLTDGQRAGEIHARGLIRLGELLPPPEETKKEITHIVRNDKGQIISKKALPKGVDIYTAHRARQYKDNPEIVEEVIQEAKEDKDFISKSAISNRIKYKKEMERVKGTRDKTMIELQGEELLYNMQLQKVLNILPAQPPKDMTEKGYAINKGYALIIIKRLEVFQNGKEKDNSRRSIGGIKE